MSDQTLQSRVMESIVSPLVVGLVVAGVTAYMTIATLDVRLKGVEVAVERLITMLGVVPVHESRITALERRLDALEERSKRP